MRKRRAAMILPFSENGGLHYRFIVPELSSRLTRRREPRHISEISELPASFRHVRRDEFTRVKRRRFAHPERAAARRQRSEEHTYDLQSLMRISYAIYCLKKTHTYKLP